MKQMKLIPRPKVYYPLTEEQVKGLLKRHNNGSIRLSKNELKAAFKSLGLHFCCLRARMAIWHADFDGDGTINSEDEFEELVKYAMTKWGFFIS